MLSYKAFSENICIDASLLDLLYEQVNILVKHNLTTVKILLFVT